LPRPNRSRFSRLSLAGLCVRAHDHRIGVRTRVAGLLERVHNHRYMPTGTPPPRAKKGYTKAGEIDVLQHEHEHDVETGVAAALGAAPPARRPLVIAALVATLVFLLWPTVLELATRISPIPNSQPHDERLAPLQAKATPNVEMPSEASIEPIRADAARTPPQHIVLQGPLNIRGFNGRSSDRMDGMMQHTVTRTRPLPQLPTHGPILDALNVEQTSTERLNTPANQHIPFVQPYEADSFYNPPLGPFPPPPPPPPPALDARFLPGGSNYLPDLKPLRPSDWDCGEECYKVRYDRGGPGG